MTNVEMAKARAAEVRKAAGLAPASDGPRGVAQTMREAGFDEAAVARTRAFFVAGTDDFVSCMGTDGFARFLSQFD